MLDSLPALPPARRWRQQAYPVAAVLALIRRDGTSQRREPVPRYLLIQRQSEPYVGKWALVGGRWEFGETLATAIIREVKEETALDTTFVALRGMVNERIAPAGSTEDGAHFLLFVCEVSAPSGAAREQAEGPVAWFNRDDLLELNERQQIISTDYTILQWFTRQESPLSFIEAEVVVRGGTGTPGELVHFGTSRR
jgi:ADP-ribose pyrophosphatase YjhB (NUDIX family)